METLLLQLKAYPTHSANYAGTRQKPKPGMINEPTGNGDYICHRSTFQVEAQNLPHTGHSNTPEKAAEALAAKIQRTLKNIHRLGKLQEYLNDHLLDSNVPQAGELALKVELDLHYGVRKPWVQLPAPTWNRDLPQPVYLFVRGTHDDVNPDTVDAYEDSVQASRGFLLKTPTDPEAHTGHKIRLNRGWLYFTDVGQADGQTTNSAGAFYVSDAQPRIARPSDRRGHHRLHDNRRTGHERPPEEPFLTQMVPHPGWQDPRLLAA